MSLNRDEMYLQNYNTFNPVRHACFCASEYCDGLILSESSARKNALHPRRRGMPSERIARISRRNHSPQNALVGSACVGLRKTCVSRPRVRGRSKITFTKRDLLLYYQY